MDTSDEPPILCRTAMLELELSHDGMAKLLNLDASRVLQMCIAGENLPAKAAHRVRIMLNNHRRFWVEHPIMNVVQELLRHLHRYGGAVQFDKLRQSFALSGRHLKNVELVEGWLTLVWEPVGKTGRHIIVYLTAKGYQEIGALMTDDAPRPSIHAKSVIAKDHDEVRQMLLEDFDKEIAYCLERVDTLRSFRLLVIHGITPIESVVRMYDRLTNGHPNLPQITDETEE